MPQTRFLTKRSASLIFTFILLFVLTFGGNVFLPRAYAVGGIVVQPPFGGGLLGYPVRNVPPGQTIDISYTVSWVGMTSEGCKSSSPCILTVSLNAPPNGWAWNLGAFTTISVTTDQGSVTKKITVTTPNTIGAKADLVVYVTCTRGCSSASLTNGFGQGLTLTVVMASTCSSTNCSTGVPEFPATLGGLLIATAILVPALILLKREHFNQSK